MTATLKIISPVDGSVYAERPLADDKAVRATLERAHKAPARLAPCRRSPSAAASRTAFVDAMVADKARVSELLAWQMGRPIRYGPGEVRGFEERARYMIAVAPEMLADIDVGPKEGFKRYHPPRAARRRPEPAGVEFPLHDGAQRRAAGDPGRQYGRDEALEPDRAGRRAFRRLLREGGSAEGRLPGPSHVA